MGMRNKKIVREGNNHIELRKELRFILLGIVGLCIGGYYIINSYDGLSFFGGLVSLCIGVMCLIGRVDKKK